MAELADAEARAEFFKRQWQRQEELGVKGIASAAKRDELQNDARAAADRVASVREKLQRVLVALNGDPELPVEEHHLVATRPRRASGPRSTSRAPRSARRSTAWW